MWISGISGFLNAPVNFTGTRNNMSSFRPIPASCIKNLTKSRKESRKNLSRLGFNYAEIRGKDAVITSGIGASYVRELLPETTSFAKIGAYPIDEEWLKSFVRRHERVLVIEELRRLLKRKCGRLRDSYLFLAKRAVMPRWRENSHPLPLRE